MVPDTLLIMDTVLPRELEGDGAAARSQSVLGDRMSVGTTDLAVIELSTAVISTAAERADVGLFVLRDRLLYANPVACELVGHLAGDLQGVEPGQFLPAGTRPAILAKLARLLSEEGDLPHHCEAQLLSRGGLLADVSVTLQRTLLDDGPALVGTMVPLTESDPSNETLTDESWFRILAETTTTAIFVYRDRLLYANPATSQLTGFSVAELANLDPIDLVHPDYRAEAHGRRQARLQGERVISRYEMPILTRNGEERWLDYSAGTILFRGELAALGIAVDITDRKAAEIKLRQSEERLQLAQQAAGLVTWDWNLLSDELVVQDSSGHISKLAMSEPIRDTRTFFARVVHPDDGPRVLAAVRDAVRGGGDYEVEHRCLTADGGERWIAERGQTIRDETGWAVRMVGVSIDIDERKKAELAREESERRLRLIIEQMPAVLWTTDRQLRFTSSQGAGLTKLGLQPDQVIGMLVNEFLSTNADAPSIYRAHEQALRGEAASHEVAVNGVTFQSHIEPLRDARGEIVGVIGVALDVTEQRRAEEALRAERERAHATLASIDDGVIRTDAQGLVEYLNPVAERLIGIPADRARGRAIDEIFHVVDETTRVPLMCPASRCLKEGRPVMLPGDRMLVSEDGAEFAIRDSAAPIRSANGEILGAVLAFKDLTAVRDMERTMVYLSSRDGLTGLLNRASFERYVAAVMERSAESGTPFALAQIDLSQLKVVNDTCGHVVGDEMIKQVARRLSALVEERHALARLGPEEFGLVFEDTTFDAARNAVDALRATFTGFRFDWQGKSFQPHLQVGLVAGDHGEGVAGLMIAIDIACMLAKESGRDRVHEYHEDDEALAERYREMHWIHRIHRALEHESFRLYCQPIVPLAEGDGHRNASPRHASPRGLLGEALIRLVDEEGRVVLPRMFVPTAERYRVISSIDRWVVRKSLALLAGEATVNGQTLDRLAVNLSGESLNEERFLEFVVQELEQSGVAGGRILFEITETAAIANLAGAMRFISELQDRGARFVLDDFGSGLSSFAYLKNLPVDYLKISSEFLRGIEETPLQRTLVRSINQIGHELGMATIAEGVETEAMLRIVRDIGVDFAQGNHLCPPMPLMGSRG